MNLESVIIGVAIGGAVMSLIPDVPTAVDYWQHRPELRPHVAGSYLAILSVIVLLVLHYRGR